MFESLNRNAGAFQAIGAILTVILAAGALAGVKLQIDAADELQRAQSARDIYREFLALSVNKPEFAQPDYCKLAGTSNEAGYGSFVEYLLYTAEQVMAVEGEWEPTFEALMEDHKHYICSIEERDSYTEEVGGLLQQFQAKHCTAPPSCS